MGKLSAAEVLRLRAINGCVHDKSVRRSAQDDGFVGGFEKHPGELEPGAIRQS
jgi:hypothetical protein